MLGFVVNFNLERLQSEVMQHSLPDVGKVALLNRFLFSLQGCVDCGCQASLELVLCHSTIRIFRLVLQEKSVDNSYPVIREDRY